MHRSLRQTHVTDFFKLQRNRLNGIEDPVVNEKLSNSIATSAGSGNPKTQISSTIKASQKVVAKTQQTRKLKPVSLPLPAKYRQLLDKFRHCDSIIGRLSNRNERCSFDRLVSAVECITKSRMTLRNLSQMVYVYPNAFKVKIERYKDEQRIEREGMFVYPDFTDYPEADEHVCPSFLARRLIKFRRILLDRTLKAHEDYLQSLPTRISIEASKIRRWHPHFHLERNTPDIPTAKLPEPRRNPVTEPVSGKMLLEIGKNVRSQRMRNVLERIAKKRIVSEIQSKPDKSIEPGRVQKPSQIGKKRAADATLTRKSVISLSSPSSDSLESSTAAETPLTSVGESIGNANELHRIQSVKPPNAMRSAIERARAITAESKRVRGVSVQLLEKIRSRERVEKMEKLITSTAEFEEEEKRSEVPRFVRAIRNYFLTEQRAALPESKVRLKVVESTHGMSNSTFDMCLETVLRDFPSWLTRVKVRGMQYIKVRRNANVNEYIDSVEKVEQSIG